MLYCLYTTFNAFREIFTVPRVKKYSRFMSFAPHPLLSRLHAAVPAVSFAMIATPMRLTEHFRLPA